MSAATCEHVECQDLDECMYLSEMPPQLAPTAEDFDRMVADASRRVAPAPTNQFGLPDLGALIQQGMAQGTIAPSFQYN